MGDSYKELMVKKEKGMKERFLRTLCVVLTVFVAFFWLMTQSIVAVIALILICVLDYYVFQCTDIEYEYLYLDKEISIDKIMAKTKRKQVATLKVEKMEILAPEKSYHLDSYKNRDVKTVDYSAGQNLAEQKLYVLYYEGNQRYLLNLDEDFAKTIQGIAPRKVFMD